MRRNLICAIILILCIGCGTYTPRANEIAIDDPGYRDCSQKYGIELVGCSVHNAEISQQMKTAIPTRKEVSRVRRDEDFVTVTYRACWVAKDRPTRELKCSLEPEDVFDPTLWSEFKRSLPWTGATITVTGLLIAILKAAAAGAL